MTCLLDALASQCTMYILGTVILPMDSVLRSPYGEWWSNQMMIAGLHTTTTKLFGSLTHPLVFRDEGICADRTLRGRSQSVVGSAFPGSSQDAGMLYGVRSTEYWQTNEVSYSVLCDLYSVQSIRSVPCPVRIWYVGTYQEVPSIRRLICVSACACQQPSKSAVRVVNNMI